jgi:hypothetical protein
MGDIRLDFLVGELPSDQTLEAKNGVLWVHNALSLGRKTDEAFSVLCERDYRRSRTRTLGILDDSRHLALHNRHARVCCSQVNTNYWACNFAVHVARDETSGNLL